MNATLRSHTGSALIITLLLLTLISGLAVEFAYEVFIDSSSLMNWRHAQQASLAARSGQTLAAAFIRELRSLPYTYPGEINIPVENSTGNDTMLSVRIEDQNAKFNINGLVFDTGQTNPIALSSLQKLFEYLTINPSLALAIADWIDPDLEPRLKNSELNSKNSRLWDLEELVLIEGIDTHTFETIRPFLTVHGDGKVNINTAPLPVLFSLHPGITEVLAERIMDYRETAPFVSPGQLQVLSGFETIGQELNVRIVTRCSAYRVISAAESHDITRVIESVVDASTTVQYWRES